ncbi:NAC domain-containing protein 83-like [Prunus avium]|uniref:NAC domain-containing protein 83-like n=1 Tax=Prunus avium TaxID=42229 RepID=A0A6P5SLQ3_PRUAV|nr:NAC domain-containing protein 83-like [Prunus avium]
MDKFNFVRNGMIRLPPGFRFQPTDEELVFQYLRCKVFSCPLPASIIPEVNVCMYDPWDLPGDLEQERYFFSNKESKYRNGSRANRVTSSGYWKATGTDKKIVSSRRNHIVGKKKTLVFYRGKAPSGCKTDWVMHEYCLVNAETTDSINTAENALNQKENWVLCRIFSKKRSCKTDEEVIRVNNAEMVHAPQTNNNQSPVSSSSSCSSSSGITEVTSSSEAGDEEEISGCTKFRSC